MKKLRLLQTILVAAVLVLALSAGAWAAADGDIWLDYECSSDVYIVRNGEERDHGISGISYNAKTNTLLLDGVDLDEWLLYAEGMEDLTIELLGLSYVRELVLIPESTKDQLTLTGDFLRTEIIRSSSDYRHTDSRIKKFAGTLRLDDASVNSYIGIDWEGDVEINGGWLVIQGGTAMFYPYGNLAPRGIYALGDIRFLGDIDADVVGIQGGAPALYSRGGEVLFDLTEGGDIWLWSPGYEYHEYYPGIAIVAGENIALRSGSRITIPDPYQFKQLSGRVLREDYAVYIRDEDYEKDKFYTVFAEGEKYAAHHVHVEYDRELPPDVLIPILDQRHKCHAFTDIVGHPLQESICYVVERSYMNGLSATIFGADEFLNRGMVATMLSRYAKANLTGFALDMPFNDTPVGVWFTPSIAWAKQKSAVEGRSELIYGPYDWISREDLATILYRYAQKNNYVTGYKSYISVAGNAEVSDYAKEAMEWAFDKGIIAPREGNQLAAREPATRGEAALAFHMYARTVGGN